MSRPKSEEKRALLLNAAASVIAARGDSAPTALIAQTAGVAEGSLFTYFPNKESLLTELYVALVAEAIGAVPGNVSAHFDARERLLCVWRGLLNWGLSNPEKWAALRILGVSHQVQRKESAPLELRRFFRDDVGVSDELPGFSAHVIRAFIDLTVELTRQRPELSEQYSAAGFESLWRAIARRS